MSIVEKSISYYLELLRDNPTTELDAPTIAMLLQAFRAYILENVKTLYLHKIALDDGDADFVFIVINDSEDEINTLDLLIENNDNIINSYGVLYGGNDQLCFNIKLNSAGTSYTYNSTYEDTTSTDTISTSLESISDTVTEI